MDIYAAMSREQYAIFMQAVIKFIKKHEIESMGALIVAICDDPALSDRLMHSKDVAEISDIEGERVMARYKQLMSVITPRLDRIFELCVGDARFRREFNIYMCTSPKWAEVLLGLDPAQFDEVCERSRGKSKDECAAIIGELVYIDDKNDLAKAVDNTYKSIY